MIEKIRASITKFRFWIRKKLYKPDTHICIPDPIWNKCKALFQTRMIVSKITDDDVRHEQEVLADVRTGSRTGEKDNSITTLQMQDVIKLIGVYERGIAKIEAFAKYNEDKDLSPESFAKALRCENIRIQILQTLVVRYVALSNKEMQKTKYEAEAIKLNKMPKGNQDGKATTESFTCESFIDFCDDLLSPAEEEIFGNFFNKKRRSDEDDEKMTLKVIDGSMDAIKDYAKKTLDRKYKHSIYSYKKEFHVSLYMDGINMGMTSDG